MPHPDATLELSTLQRGPDYVRCMEVFVTNQCNMGCTNCCVATSEGASDAVSLTWKDLKPAVDIFMDPAQTPYNGKKAIVFAGGESLIEYPLILRSLKYAHETFEMPPYVEVYTNGSMITREMVENLQRYEATIIFSLDGGKEGNDLYRTFSCAPEKSVFDEVMRRLDGIPKTGCATNTIIHPGNLQGLVEALDHFNKIGFGQIDMWLDYLHLWTPFEVAALEDFMKELCAYYVRRTREEGRIPFIVPMINHALYNGSELAKGRTWWKDCFRLVLGADGHFYDCEGALLLPYQRIADSNNVNKPSDGKGVDWAARQAYMDEADIYMETLGADKDWQDVCPRMYYKAMGLMGQDSRHMVDNLHRTSRAFLLGLVKLADELKDNESFKQTYLKKVLDTPG